MPSSSTSRTFMGNNSSWNQVEIIKVPTDSLIHTYFASQGVRLAYFRPMSNTPFISIPEILQVRPLHRDGDCFGFKRCNTFTTRVSNAVVHQPIGSFFSPSARKLLA